MMLAVACSLLGLAAAISPGRKYLGECPFDVSLRFDMRDDSFIMRLMKPEEVLPEAPYTHYAVQFNSDDYEGQYTIVFEDGSGTGQFPEEQTLVSERIISSDGDCGQEFRAAWSPLVKVMDNDRAVRVQRGYYTGARGYIFDEHDMHLSYTCCLGYAECAGLDDPVESPAAAACGSGRVDLGTFPTRPPHNAPPGGGR